MLAYFFLGHGVVEMAGNRFSESHSHAVHSHAFPFPFPILVFSVLCSCVLNFLLRMHSVRAEVNTSAWTDRNDNVISAL